jgi:endonuclease YncB( thermonuclease family)
MRYLLIFISLMVALPVSAGTMVRVLRVGDNGTVVVQGKGGETVLHLAGIEITEAAATQSLLRWCIGTSWVMVEAEPLADKNFVYLYRSPDALFVNHELVERGYARATLPAVQPASHVPVTYLGELNPPSLQIGRELKEASPPSSGSDRSRRSKASPARPSRSRANARKKSAK